MSADKELLLLSAAASAMLISLAAFSCNLNGKHDYVTSMSTQVLCHAIRPNAIIGCNIFASQIFSNTLQSLQLLHGGIAGHCMQ